MGASCSSDTCCYRTYFNSRDTAIMQKGIVVVIFDLIWDRRVKQLKRKSVLLMIEVIDFLDSFVACT